MVYLHNPLAPAPRGRRERVRPYRPAPAAAPAAATVWRPASNAGLGCVVAVLIARLVAPGLLDAWTVPIGVIGILLGIPHGAVDHLVPFWESGRRITATGLLRVLAAYVAVAAVAVSALLIAPALTLVGFLVASALHFGQAEVEFAAERRATLPSTLSVRGRQLRVAAHGLTVVALPIAIWHSRVHGLLVQVAPALAGRGAGLAFDALAVAAVALDALTLRSDLARHRRLEAAETVLIVLLMALVPPVPAFAVYFGAWHAMRHTARLLTLPGPGGRPLSARAALRRYAAHALPPTVVVVVALGAVVATGSRSVITSALIVLIALTFPHMRTVAAFDRTRQAARA